MYTLPLQLSTLVVRLYTRRVPEGSPGFSQRLPRKVGSFTITDGIARKKRAGLLRLRPREEVKQKQDLIESAASTQDGAT
jgi:hypothetical protein